MFLHLQADKKNNNGRLQIIINLNQLDEQKYKIKKKCKTQYILMSVFLKLGFNADFNAILSSIHSKLYYSLNKEIFTSLKGNIILNSIMCTSPISLVFCSHTIQTFPKEMRLGRKSQARTKTELVCRNVYLSFNENKTLESKKR